MNWCWYTLFPIPARPTKAYIHKTGPLLERIGIRSRRRRVSLHRKRTNQDRSPSTILRKTSRNPLEECIGKHPVRRHDAGSPYRFCTGGTVARFAGCTRDREAPATPRKKGNRSLLGRSPNKKRNIQSHLHLRHITQMSNLHRSGTAFQSPKEKRSRCQHPLVRRNRRSRLFRHFHHWQKSDPHLLRKHIQAVTIQEPTTRGRGRKMSWLFGACNDLWQTVA